jgi:hypothetical protein
MRRYMPLVQFAMGHVAGAEREECRGPSSGDDRVLLETLETKEQLAAALGVKYQKHIVYYLFRMASEKRYRPFEIKKRSGGMRTISAPYHGLKVVQKRLAKLLAENYGRRGGVHGYVEGRSILTNAASRDVDEFHVPREF